MSNTEVWDIRTFHLLKTVPVLNQCSVMFSPVNTAIYAISMEQEMDDGDSTYDSSFKTVDAIDYSSIGKNALFPSNQQAKYVSSYRKKNSFLIRFSQVGIFEKSL